MTALSPNASRHLADKALQLISQLDEAVAGGEPADVVLNQYFRAHKQHGAKDRRFLGDAIFSWFRWNGWVSSEPRERAAALACLLDGLAHPPVSSLVNAANIPSDTVQRLSAADLAGKARAFQALTGHAVSLNELLPGWVKEELAADVFTPCVEAFQKRPPTWLRARSVRPAAILQALSEQNIQAILHANLPEALAVPGSSALAQLSPAVQSQFEVQDLASQAVGLVCAPRPGETWWDVCAASGGKSLHLADLMRQQGRVLATDVRPDALRRLRVRADRAGCAIITTAAVKGLEYPTKELFDGVLVDAPCSGLGTWSRQPDARWRTPRTDIARRAEQQKAILAQATRRVRPGGVLVYSVCTLTRAETLDRAHDFLAHHPDFQPGTVQHPLSGKTEPGGMWVYPWDGPCDGMFIARFERKA